MIGFEGRTAVVTGAGQGIGAGIAGLFVRLGASVCLLDTNADAAAEQARRIDTRGRTVLPYSGDVRDKRLLARLVAEVVERWGRIDILVNNAGIIRDNMLENMSEEDWDDVVDVNLKGAFLCSQAVAPHMKERLYGKIVNISSRSWLGNIGQANYAASKGGLVSLTRTLALELAKFNINVNAVAPGLIDTPMTRSLPQKVRERLLRMQPTGEIGTPEDIANAVCFLASDAASFITGQVLHVDGGKSCGGGQV